MSGREILFYFPQGAFLMLFLLPLLYSQFALHRYRQYQQQIYASHALLSRLLISRSSILTFTKIIGWSLIWIFTCLALMEPFGNIRYSSLNTYPPSFEARAMPHEVIFLVDTSASMRVPDGPEKETRLEEAKNIIEDVIRQLHGQTISLYAFTSELSPIVPPTLDYLFTRLSIKDLHINEGDVGGTRLASILKSLQEQAFPHPSSKYYTIFLFSDGGDNQLESLTGEAKEQEKQAILKAISNPEQFHLHLFTIGLGSLKPQTIPDVTSEGRPVFSKLEPTILKELAAQLRGKYYQAQEWTSWNLAKELFSQMEEDEWMISQEFLKERQITAIKKEDRIVDLYYQVPLGLALLFYFLNLLLPDVRRV